MMNEWYTYEEAFALADAKGLPAIFAEGGKFDVMQAIDALSRDRDVFIHNWKIVRVVRGVIKEIPLSMLERRYLSRNALWFRDDKRRPGYCRRVSPNRRIASLVRRAGVYPGFRFLDQVVVTEYVLGHVYDQNLQILFVPAWEVYR